MVLLTLALPLLSNLLAIYLLASFSLFTILSNKQLKWQNGFIILCIAFFSVHLLHYLTDDNTNTLNFELERKLSFALLPLAWFNLAVQHRKSYLKKVLLFFSYGINLIGLFFFFWAGIKYLNTGNVDVFYYHDFVDLFAGSAIYYSLLFSISLIALFESNKIQSTPSKLLFIALNTILLVLLSSKIFVFTTVLLYLFYFLSLKKGRLLLIGVSLLFISAQFFNNGQHIANRYADLNIESILSSEDVQLSPVTEFDGLSLRKELWKMGWELSTQDWSTFLWGIGPGDAQEMLNQKIIDRNMYIGETGTTDNGYLGYNFHNQYMQTLVEVGAIGLLLLLSTIFYLIRLGIQQQNRLLVLVNCIFIIGFLTESFLSRQVGVVSFLGCNSFFILAENEVEQQSFNSASKRIFDIVFSLFVILFVLSWLLPVLCLLIYIETRSFPFFIQQRMGQNNKPFNCIKLKTMTDNAEANNTPAQIDDNRITKIGGFLRKYGMDELPQFFNVFWGEMSVVGPRPLMLSEEEKFGQIVQGFSMRLKAKPGITGLAQAYGYKGYVNNKYDIRIRYKLDVLYSKEQSLNVDLKIIAKTIQYIIKQ